MNQADFNALYWASKDPRIKAAQDLEFSPGQGLASPRGQTIGQLMASGVEIDVPIMLWGWDPFNIMTLRQSFGYEFVPSASGMPIKVSLDPKDYPPFGGK